jgi:hypothetical protein
MDENFTDYYFELGLELMNKYKNFSSQQYLELQDSCDQERRSVGGLMNMFGIYSFDIFDKLFANNYDPGKFQSNDNKKFDFKYYYKAKKLSIIEKYANGVLYKINIVQFNNYQIVVSSYKINYQANELRLDSITYCKYNSKNRIEFSVKFMINSDKIQGYDVHKYTFGTKRIEVVELSYSKLINISYKKQFVLNKEIDFGYIGDFDI